jgi:oxygen-independent coproporphyrinogen-3 oxidase
VIALASLYVHIPFCARKCLYCDFYSVERPEAVEDFLAALSCEIALRRPGNDHVTFDTTFFGGGTPSLLAPWQLESILTRLHATFRIASNAEITLEANPGTVTLESLRAFHALGVNRLSLGIQSFHDADLRFLGRMHDSAEAFRCLEWSRTAGFDNISVDVMYAIPGQTLDRWQDTLRMSVELAPQHIAAYNLTVEDQTPLAHRIRAGEIRTTPTHREAQMYEMTMEWFAAHGYEHYEVSNYARPGFRCRHNCAYWSHEDYLGFGPSAHSFWKRSDARRGRRWCNVADLSNYTALLERGRLPIASEEDVGIRELVQERILLGLRSGGLDLARLATDFECDLEASRDDMIRWMLEEDLALREGRVLRLTPRGYVLCDEICSRLFRNVGSSPDNSRRGSCILRDK